MPSWAWWVVAIATFILLQRLFSPAFRRGGERAVSNNGRAAPYVARPAAITRQDIIDMPDDDGAFEYDVVGESNYQLQLERIAGRNPDGVRFQVGVLLVPEPDNPYDPHAIRVVIGGATVGYIPREDSQAFSETLRGRKGRCLGLIVGGWDRGARGRGHYGVRLDIEPPDED